MFSYFSYRDLRIQIRWYKRLYLNIIKTTFGLNCIFIRLWIAWILKNIEIKRSCQSKSFSLITCDSKKNFFTIKTRIKKSSFVLLIYSSTTVCSPKQNSYFCPCSWVTFIVVAFYQFIWKSFLCILSFLKILEKITGTWIWTITCQQKKWFIKNLK